MRARVRVKLGHAGSRPNRHPDLCVPPHLSLIDLGFRVFVGSVYGFMLQRSLGPGSLPTSGVLRKAARSTE